MEYKPGRCLLKYRLKQIGENQQWLANELNMSKAQISNYANNVTPMGLGIAYTIAKTIGCTIEDLYLWKITTIKRNQK